MSRTHDNDDDEAARDPLLALFLRSALQLHGTSIRAKMWGFRYRRIQEVRWEEEEDRIIILW
jgi:hypothetical protein